jgi:hypothetical protein
MSRLVLKLFLPVALTFGCLAGFAPAASAQTTVATFTLDDVFLLADISDPWTAVPVQMTGTFEWTYTPGDFENGTGVFLDVFIPYWGSDLNLLDITVDLSSIEFSLNGNYHSRGVDVTLFLLNDLAPDTPAVVDTVRSTFHIEAGDYRGHAISGSVAPEAQMDLLLTGTCPAVQVDIDGVTTGGQVALLYAFAPGAFAVPVGYPCAGTVLGLDGSVTLGSMLVADANGSATLNVNVPAGACGSVYLQALDLSSCGLSEVVLLQ